MVAPVGPPPITGGPIDRWLNLFWDATQSTSGTYTPTLTNVTNVLSSIGAECWYQRMGGHVVVYGLVKVTATAAGQTKLGMSLPVSSSFVDDTKLQGVGATYIAGTQNASCIIYADATNSRAELEFYANAGGAKVFRFTYHYGIA